MEDMEEILNHYGIVENVMISAIQVKKTYEKMCGKIIGEEHLTQNEVDIMLFLTYNEKKDTSADIARYRCISKSQVCKSVDALTRDGYLLVQQDQQDRRYQHLKLSEKGHAIMKQLEKGRKNFYRQLQTDLSEEEIETLRTILRKIRKNVTECQV
jgi:DNA-binding MarR family transcriptional regulator